MQVAKRFDEFQRIGVSAVAVAMSRPPMLALYLRESPLPFPIVGDPDRQAYAAFGLERTSWLEFVKPWVIFGYLMAILRGGKIRRIAPGEDPLQTGADFMFDGVGRLRWAHRSANPNRRPSIQRLLAAAQSIVVDERPPAPTQG